eukprot:Skav232799  [mRNA]  locus=scaffold614:318390:319139:+ [translate_table: standard]
MLLLRRVCEDQRRGYFLTTMVGIVLAYAVAAVAPNMEAANALLPTYVTTCLYFGLLAMQFQSVSGLFIVFEKIPDGWYWYSWTSFLRYAWGMLMLNQFQDQPTGKEAVFYSDNTAVTLPSSWWEPVQSVRDIIIFNQFPSLTDGHWVLRGLFEQQ